MAIENFEEVKSYFETNKDNEEVKGYVKGFNNLDGVKSFLESNEDGKKYLNSYADTKVTKGIESFKTNNLSTLVDAEVKKRFPDADPKDVELKNMKAMLEQMKADGTKKELTNKALKMAQEKKLPTDLVDYFIGSDEETTNKNIEKFIATMAAHDEAIKLEFAKSNSYTPPKGTDNLKLDEKARAEIAKYMK